MCERQVGTEHSRNSSCQLWGKKTGPVSWRREEEVEAREVGGNQIMPGLGGFSKTLDYILCKMEVAGKF